MRFRLAKTMKTENFEDGVLACMTPFSDHEKDQERCLYLCISSKRHMNE